MSKFKLFLYYSFSFAIMIVPTVIILIFIKIFSRILLVRLGSLPSDRIGHLSIDIELYLCKLKNNKLKKKIKDFFFIPNNKQVSNYFLIDIWSEQINIIQKFFVFPLWFFMNTKILKYLYKDHILDHRSKNFPHFDNEYLIPTSKQNIILKKSDENECYNLLKKNNINTDKKFVCLHVRDNLYLKKKYPLKDYSYHDYRDFEINDFKKLCDFFEDKGFLIFRMGNASLKKIEFANNNIIDYSNSSFLSDKMDVFLISKCSIFIGAESGLLSLAQCFRKPLLNILGKPLVPATHYNTLYSFKNLHKLSNNKPLSLKEIISKDLYNVNDTKTLQAKGVYFKDLTENEIFECGVDIYQFYMNKCNLDKKEIKKQKDFYDNFLKEAKKKEFDPKYVVHHNGKYLSYIAPSFLNNYPILTN